MKKRKMDHLMIVMIAMMRKTKVQKYPKKSKIVEKTQVTKKTQRNLQKKKNKAQSQKMEKNFHHLQVRMKKSNKTLKSLQVRIRLP